MHHTPCMHNVYTPYIQTRHQHSVRMHIQMSLVHMSNYICVYVYIYTYLHTSYTYICIYTCQTVHSFVQHVGVSFVCLLDMHIKPHSFCTKNVVDIYQKFEKKLQDNYKIIATNCLELAIIHLAIIL